MHPTLSIIIPVFNRRDYLERALKSVIAQSYTDYEIIVVDDGSDSPLQPWLSVQFPSVKYIYQSRSGVSQARNAGIKQACGQWIALLDSDDEWLEEKLEKQMRALSASQLQICHSDEIWIRNGKRINPAKKHQKRGGDIFEQCLSLCAMSPSSIIIHRQVFEQVGLFDVRLPACEDYDLWLRVSAQYEVCYLDKRLLIKYAGHDDQLSRRHWGMDRFRIRALEKLLKYTPLTDYQTRLALVSLLKKISIFSKGALKQNKQVRHQRYQLKYQHYQARLDGCLKEGLLNNNISDKINKKGYMFG